MRPTILRWGLLFASSVYLPTSFSQQFVLDDSQEHSVTALQSTADDINTIDTLGNQNIDLPDLVNPVEQQSVAKASEADLRIGFINFRRIMASIPQLKSVSSTLDREFDQQKSVLTSKQTELAEMEKILSNMSRGDAYSDYEKQVIAKRRDYVREEAAYRDAYSVRRNEELAKLQRIVVDEIVALAKESNYDVILNDTGVIYVSENADLTTIVIERLRAIGE